MKFVDFVVEPDPVGGQDTFADGLVTQAGFGYLLKDRVLEVGEFLATAQRIANGGSALDPKVVVRLVSPAAARPLERLSERERRLPVSSAYMRHRSSAGHLGARPWALDPIKRCRARKPAIPCSPPGLAFPGTRRVPGW